MEGPALDWTLVSVNTGSVRTDHHAAGVLAVVPANEARYERFDGDLYRERNVVEPCLGRLKERRRVAARYEMLVLHYLVMVKLNMRRRLLGFTRHALVRIVWSALI